MNFSDTSFKRISLRVGVVMLVFFGLYNLLLTPAAVMKEIFTISFDGEQHLLAEFLIEVWSTIGFGVAYLLAFLIPAIVFRLITPKEERKPLGIKKAPVKELPLIILAAVAVIFACAQINALIVSHFDFYDSFQEAMTPSGPMMPYQILLELLVTALVSAICEEILFRSTILSNLVPYGKGFAIIASAILFGLMHMNPAQLFYATAAGAVLGYVYVKTGSFWCVFLIHFVNNLLSVLQTAAFSDPDYIMGARFVTLVDAAVAILGFVSVVILAIMSSKKNMPCDMENAGFILDSHDGYIEKVVSFSPIRRFFASPTVLIFTIICIVEALSILLFYGVQY